MNEKSHYESERRIISDRKGWERTEDPEIGDSEFFPLLVNPKKKKTLY